MERILSLFIIGMAMFGTVEAAEVCTDPISTAGWDQNEKNLMVGNSAIVASGAGGSWTSIRKTRDDEICFTDHSGFVVNTTITRDSLHAEHLVQEAAREAARQAREQQETEANTELATNQFSDDWLDDIDTLFSGSMTTRQLQDTVKAFIKHELSHDLLDGRR